MPADETPALVVEHLDVKPGDRLLVRLPEATTQDVVKRIAEQFEREFPDNRLIALAGGIELTVEPDDAPPLCHELTAEDIEQGRGQTAHYAIADPDDPMQVDQQSGVEHAEVLSIEESGEILAKCWDPMVETNTHLAVRRFHYDASIPDAPVDGIVIVARGEAAQMLSDFTPTIPSFADAPTAEPPPTPGLGRPEVSG